MCIVAADPKKTVLKGTSSNAVVAKNMDKPSVAGCYAKLLNAQPYRWVSNIAPGRGYCPQN